jgi:histidinol-phosphatase
LLAAHANLAVLRTLSKARALAAARVGTLIAAPELIALLRRCQAPYPVPTPCAELAVQALQPAALARTAERVATVIAERERLRAALVGLPGVCRVYASAGNYLLVRFADPQSAFDTLLAAGVVVRDQRAAPQLGDALRISIGSPEENDRVLAALSARRACSMTLILFIDRDGTLIEEPSDFQIDAYEKLRFVPQVIPALLKLRDAGYQFVIVTNQDGLGSDSYPRASFDGPNDLMLQIFESQGITFRDVLIDSSWPQDNAPTRKPGIGLMTAYLQDRSIDWARSGMVGDRITDLQFADNLNIRGFQLRTAQFGGVGLAGHRPCAGRRAAHRRCPAQHQRNEDPRRTDLDRAVMHASPPACRSSTTCWNRSASTAASRWTSRPRVTCTSTSTTPSRTPGWPWARPCARRWATSAALAATASPADGRDAGQRCAGLQRPSVFRVRGRVQARAWATCRPSWCRISSARCAMPAV